MNTWKYPNLPEISYRPATIDDLELLRHWDTQPHVIAASEDDWEWETELLRFPPWRQFLIAEHEGRPIGFLQIIDPALEDSHYWGEMAEGYRAIDIWIGEATDLGKSFGTSMMTLALDDIFSDPSVKAVLIDPLATNTRAHRFYERIGFRFVEERWFDTDRCFVYQLDRGEWEYRI